MRFKILNAYDRDNVTWLSGIYCPDNEAEREDLELLREVLKEVNINNDGVLLTDRFVSNDKTMLIKSVPMDVVYTLLYLQNSSFNLNIKVVFGRNMQGKALKNSIADYFRGKGLLGGADNEV